MRFTPSESAALLLLALPQLISALPLNPASPIEQLVPVHPSKRSNTWILENRDSTSTATNIVMETISNGVGIPGFAAPQTSTSAVTKVQTSFVTHSASVVTVVGTEGVDTTCTETTTSLAGFPTVIPGSTPTDATSTPPHSTFAHPSGTASAGPPTRKSTQTVHASGTRIRSSRPSGTNVRSSRPSATGVRSSRPSATGVRSSRPSVTGVRSSRPSGTGIRPSGSGSVTTIIGSTSTERAYTTIDASAASSIVTVSGVKQSASASSVHLSSSVSGVKVVATATGTVSAVVGEPTVKPTESVHTATAHPSSSSVVPKASSSSVEGKPSSSSTHVSSSSAAKTSSAAATAKATATATKAGGGSPVETNKVVYKGAQKVEPFMK